MEAYINRALELLYSAVSYALIYLLLDLNLIWGRIRTLAINGSTNAISHVL